MSPLLYWDSWFFGPLMQNIIPSLLLFFMVLIFSPSLKALKHFLDPVLHIFAIFPESMLAIHSIYNEMYRTLPGPKWECGPSSTEPQGDSHLLMSACDGIHAAVPPSSLAFGTHLSAFTIRKGNWPSIWVEKEGLVLRNTQVIFPGQDQACGCNVGPSLPLGIGLSSGPGPLW